MRKLRNSTFGGRYCYFLNFTCLLYFEMYLDYILHNGILLLHCQHFTTLVCNCLSQVTETPQSIKQHKALNLPTSLTG